MSGVQKRLRLDKKAKRKRAGLHWFVQKVDVTDGQYSECQSMLAECCQKMVFAPGGRLGKS